MSMHLIHPGLTTLNTAKRKKKPSVSQQRAKHEHDEWLRKQGIHPEQLAKKVKKPGKLKYTIHPKDESGPCSNGFADGGAKKSIFDGNWQDRYKDDPLMAEREQLALKKAEALKARVLPLYNKGGLQLMPEGLKMTDLGKRRP
jgi:hypothetical protein